MATITEAVTAHTRTSNGTVKWLFKYTLDNGEVHYRRAWRPVGTDEATERTLRGNMMLDELAQAEIAAVLDG